MKIYVDVTKEMDVVLTDGLRQTALYLDDALEVCIGNWCDDTLYWDWGTDYLESGEYIEIPSLEALEGILNEYIC